LQAGLTAVADVMAATGRSRQCTMEQVEQKKAHLAKLLD
jgi:hypothetical protein